MTERPILFSDAMVRAILDGRKTQTRRPYKPIRPHPYEIIDDLWPLLMDEYGEYHRRPCPYGQPGDRLWVRETWGLVYPYTDWETGIVDDVSDWGKPIPESRPHRPWRVWYRADDRNWDPTVEDRGFRWRPSIHMPRWASRVTLEITDVRVERVQAISEEGAIAEGIERILSIGPARTMGWRDYSGGPGFSFARNSFASLWDSVYESKGLGWEANPFVWAIEFRRVEGEQ